MSAVYIVKNGLFYLDCYGAWVSEQADAKRFTGISAFGVAEYHTEGLGTGIARVVRLVPRGKS